MGALDKTATSIRKRQIRLIDITALSASEVEAAFNGMADRGLRFIQIVQIRTNTYIVAEQEL